MSHIPPKVRILILTGPEAGQTPLHEILEHDIVLLDEGPGCQWYKVFTNKWSDRCGVVPKANVQQFLESCGLRSAT